MTAPATTEPSLQPANGKGGKIAGAILFTLGALIIIVGAAVVAFGINDQADNEDSGPLNVGEDQDRTDQNTSLIEAGVVALGLGGLLAIAGSIAIAVGIAKRTGQVKAAWLAVRERHRTLLGQQPQGDPDDAIDDGDAAAPSSDFVGPPKPVLVVTGIVAVIVLLGAIVYAMGIDPVEAITGGGDDQQPQAALIGDETVDGTVPAAVTVLGSTNTPFSTTTEFTAEVGTGRMTLQLDWSPVAGGSETLRFDVEIFRDTWVLLESKTGAPGLQVNVTADDLSGASLRFSVWPGADGVHQGQDYTVAIQYYRGAAVA